MRRPSPGAIAYVLAVGAMVLVVQEALLALMQFYYVSLIVALVGAVCAISVVFHHARKASRDRDR